MFICLIIELSAARLKLTLRLAEIRLARSWNDRRCPQLVNYNRARRGSYANPLNNIVETSSASSRLSVGAYLPMISRGFPASGEIIGLERERKQMR